MDIEVGKYYWVEWCDEYTRCQVEAVHEDGRIAVAVERPYCSPIRIVKKKAAILGPAPEPTTPKPRQWFSWLS